MPLDDLSSSQNLNKPVANQPKASSYVIKKSHNLLNTCPINTVRERLPQIEEKCMKKLPKKNKISCSDQSTEWLKPGVSLPKLRTRSVISKRPDAGEPYTVPPAPLPTKKLFDCAWISPSTSTNLPLNGSLLEEDVSEDDKNETVGPSKCQSVFNVPSSELVFDDIEIPEEHHEPSRALQLWEIWMKKRKHMQDVICEKLNRKPFDLVINQNESYRTIREDKAVFTYAQLPEADREEGSSRKAKSKKKHNLSDSFQEETKREGALPEMEFIDIPRVISIEKGYISEGENKVMNRTTKSWEESPYRKERSQLLKRQRSKLKPNKIEVDELAVVGKQICPTAEVEYSASDSTIYTPKIYVDDGSEDSVIEDRKSIACLVIDGIELKRELGSDYNNLDSNEVESNYTWQVEFGLNKVQTFVEKSITVENKGTVAISYSWVPKKPGERLPNKIHQGIREPWFFFNKNSGIFLPGQIYHLKFYHHTHKAGTQTEIWSLVTSPTLFATPESCRFILTAVAEDDGPEKEVNSVRRYLNNRVGVSFIKRLLDKIIYDATHPCLGLDYIEYRCFFLEKELFEFHNPKHYYECSIVADLKDLFQKVCGDSQSEWDFSLSSLLKLTMANTYGDCRNSFLTTISQSSRKLFRPNYVAIRKGQSHRMAYQILCKMTSFMEKDYKHLRKCLSWRRKERKEYFGEGSIQDYGELEDVNVQFLYYTNANNLAYFETMFYMKVYQRMCDAVEHIADILETNKFLEPRKKKRVIGSECF